MPFGRPGDQNRGEVGDTGGPTVSDYKGFSL